MRASVDLEKKRESNLGGDIEREGRIWAGERVDFEGWSDLNTRENRIRVGYNAEFEENKRRWDNRI